MVTVAVSYIDNEFRPRGFTDTSHSNPDGLMLKDVSNAILHTHTPYEQGLVHAPEIPEMAVCPSTGTGSGALFWMINAEIVDRINDSRSRYVPQSTVYLDVLTKRVKRLEEYRDRVRDVAITMAERIRAGGRWFCAER